MSQKYHYVGRYKSPLLYHWVCLPRSDGERLPRLNGGMILDGHMFVKKEEWDGAKEKVKISLESGNYSIFRDLFKEAKTRTHEVMSIINDLSKSKELSPESVRKYFDAIREMEYPWWLTLPVGESLEEYVRKLEGDKLLTAAQLASFFEPIRSTPLTKQREEMLLLKSEANKSDLTKKMEVHVEKYKWVGMMHLWGDPFNLEKLIEQMRNAKAEEKHKTTQMIGKYAELRKISQGLVYWRQFCADTCAMASLFALTYLGREAERMGIDYAEAKWVTPNEFIDVLNKGKLPDKKMRDERKRGFGVIVDENKSLVTGKELNLLIESMLPKVDSVSQVKGIVACGGWATGPARIVLSPDDCLRVQVGDILIASETTPDFTPAFGKVKAIVTDQGGIGSHAAIIGREFNIPCIVGTKIATRIFKDGDLVEVDANKGIVRKLKK